LRTAPISQVKRVSEYGLLQDFLIVGKFANVLIVIIRILDIAGCFAKTHIPVATKAIIKVIVSNLVISFCPFFNPKINIVKQRIAAAKVVNAPAPPLPKICSAKIIKVIKAQINQL
jgi:hypothetical protein